MTYTGVMSACLEEKKKEALTQISYVLRSEEGPERWDDGPKLQDAPGSPSHPREAEQL